MKRLFSICLALSFLFSTLASADEGMWLYNAAPEGQNQSQIWFRTDAAVAGSRSALFSAV